MSLTQLCIAMLGLSSLLMALSEHSVARWWAPIVGLAAQPFWLYVTFTGQQWGIFALSCAYTAVYMHAAWQRLQRTFA